MTIHTTLEKLPRYTIGLNVTIRLGLNTLLSVITLLVFASAGFPAAEDVPELAVSTISSRIEIDGLLDEAAWATAKSVDRLTTVEPVEGSTPSGQTIVKVLTDRKALFIGIVCHDSDAGGIVSFSKSRDADLEKEDHIRIVLDPFQDGRSGYIFAVNPSGARYDALVANRGEGEDSNWDGIWEAKAKRDAKGWSTELWIPIQTLTFKRRSSKWNFNVQRRVQRLQETSRWASPKIDYQITQTSRAGHLTNIPEFDLGFGLSIRPSMVLGVTNPAPGAQTNWDSDFSLDFMKRLGPQLRSYLTINTDFAETEVDTRQINLTRFPLFFPEKRTFLLEGSDIFDFGLGLDTDIIPFFSRRIGLVEGRQVPLQVGAKINGRIGHTNIGGLAVQTGSADDLVDTADMGVIRVKQDVFAESSLGMIATFGSPENEDGSWLTGLDFTYQTSRFREDKNFLVGVWGLISDRNDLKGNKSAYGFKIDYPNDLWDVALKYKKIGDAFNPSLGFVPRRAAQISSLSVVYSPRPGWKLVRQMFHEAEFQYVTDLEGNWQTYEGFFAPVNWRLESGDRFEFNLMPEGDRTDNGFEIGDGVIIEPGTYRWNRYRVEFESAAKRKAAGVITYGWGDFYDGSLNSTVLQFVWNPVPLTTIEVSAEHHAGNLSGGDFIENLVGSRIKFNISPDIQINSFFQYDTGSSSLGTNTRMRWTLTPYVELFVIYNHNFLDTERGWIRQSNQILAKFQYTFQR